MTDKRVKTPSDREFILLCSTDDAEIDARDKFGCTALYFAAEWGCPEVAELLIQHGADINARDNCGQTPLRLAVENCHTETASLLRSYGAQE